MRKISYLCILGLLTFIFSATAFAQQTLSEKYPAYGAQVQKLSNQYQAKIDTATDKAKEKFQTRLATIKAKNNVASKSNASQKPPTKTCDCNASTTENSAANNFLYNSNGERTIRIDPYCKCGESSANNQAAQQQKTASTAAATNTDDKSTKKPSTLFGIHY
jgi:hypothetical protein